MLDGSVTWTPPVLLITGMLTGDFWSSTSGTSSLPFLSPWEKTVSARCLASVWARSVKCRDSRHRASNRDVYEASDGESACSLAHWRPLACKTSPSEFMILPCCLKCRNTFPPHHRIPHNCWLRQVSVSGPIGRDRRLQLGRHLTLLLQVWKQPPP